MNARGQRADVALVTRGLFPSRAKAAEAIAAGLVRVDGRAIAKASEPLSPTGEIDAQAPYPWVSRGGVKLVAALDAFAIDPAGRACLDVGASTGGFTDVLLTRGAAHVTAIDVGHGQLHPRIAADPRVTALEKTDARGISCESLECAPSLVVIDLSFISLRLVLPAIATLAAPDADLIALVKPQFEVGPAHFKNGIMRDTVRAEAARDAIADFAHTLGWSVRGTMPSPISGGDGNREFLLVARRAGKQGQDALASLARRGAAACSRRRGPSRPNA